VYHPDIIAAREEALLRSPAGRALHPNGIPKYSSSDTKALAAQVQSSYDETGTSIRPLTEEEERFIGATTLRCAYDAPFFLQTMTYIDQEGHGVRSLYPLWESQQFLLDRLAHLEMTRLRERSKDGLLMNVLKIRQVGITTLGTCLVMQRVITRPHLRALLGSDIEGQAGYLFRMADRVYKNLPGFLRPSRASTDGGSFVKDREMVFSNGSGVKTVWGKTTRGALSDVGGTKGNIARGMSQPLTEPVLTPFGWTRMGYLKVDDLVLGANGRPVRVVGVYPQGVEAVYRVTFSDGAWTECSGSHLWNVTTSYRRWAGLPAVTKSTLDLLNGGLLWNKPSGPTFKWQIPMTAPIQFPARRLPLSPYLVGVVIGDGCTRHHRVQIAARDPEIRLRVERELPAGCRTATAANGHDWHIRAANRSDNPVIHALRYLKLSHLYAYQKHIPDEYLFAPIVDRQALLQGLMDTDGTANRRSRKVVFTTTSPQLAKDFRQLVESLGGTARMTTREPQTVIDRKRGGVIHGRHRSYVFSVQLPPEIVPFSLPRKCAQLVPVEERKYFPCRSIRSIEYIGEKPTQCIRVDAADHLYLTRHCVVTHNTFPVWHISELATWENPEQLDTAFLPGIPVSRETLGLLESTAELADDWWHRQWETTKQGIGRFTNVFIPNYAVASKYSATPPEGWAPSPTTTAWVEKAVRESPQWFDGRTIRPTKDQAYWYESTRAYYEAKGDLGGFFKEYPSDDEECFRYAGSSVLTLEQSEQLNRQARPLIDVWAVEPSRDIAELKRIAPHELQPDARKAAPISLRVPPREAETFPVPPGYGFRRLPPEDLTRLAGGMGLKDSVMAIWEYPRTRGPRRYVMGVDVAYGVGQDYSVITIVRMPTIEEPGEEVAQYCSNTLLASQVAWVCDAMGRFYRDDDDVEALAAIEANVGPGLSTQDVMKLHLGYTNFYVWEYANAKEADRRYSQRIGWYTTPFTRPLLIANVHEAITRVDPISHTTDFILNSPTTRAEWRHLIIPRGATLGQAEAAPAHHDDAVLSSAIGYYVAWRLAGGEQEPISERRARRAAVRSYESSGPSDQRRDYRNTDIEADQIQVGADGRDDDDDEHAPLYFNDRASE
jgi:LAGLIDADG-like domain